MFESPRLKFVGAAGAKVGAHEASWDQGKVVMSKQDFGLAQLFDGFRTPDEILQLAAQQLSLELDRGRLEGFAAALSAAGLLKAGRDEPLPVPAHSDAEAFQLGWLGGGRRMPKLAQGASLPPSTVAGSRANPGFVESIIGRQPESGWVFWQLPSHWITGLGAPLSAMLHYRVLTIGFLALLLTSIGAVIAHRLEWIAHAGSMVGGWTVLLHIAVSMVLINVFSVAARASMIYRQTGKTAGLTLTTNFLGLPQLFVRSAGAVELANRRTRMRIVAAAPLGVAALLVCAIVLWFVFHASTPGIANQALATSIAASVALVLRLNPLAQTDGYYWLANALNQLDLREQARLSLFGLSRPWNQQARPLPRRYLVIYGLSSIAFVLLVLVLLFVFLGDWLAERYGGIGFLFFIGALGTLMQKQYISSGGGRSSMGLPRRKFNISRRQKWIFGILLVLCLIPYHYEPSGEFEVLPGERADVRALIDGDVREVFVKEGEQVSQGQIIARLDDAAPKASLAGAEAARARLQAELSLAQKGAKKQEIEVARQKMNTARKAAQIARAQADRLRSAFSRKSVTAQDYERARGAAEVADQQFLEAKRAFELVASPAVEDRIKALEAAVAEAEAKITYQKQALEYTQIRAPIDGQIVSQQLLFARGAYLKRGDLLAVIEDSSQVMGEIRIPEASIPDVRMEGVVSAKPWAYPGRSFEGRVLQIAPVAEDDRYSRVVRVQIELQDPERRLSSGMTGNAKVDGGWHLSIVVFTKALARFVLVEIWSWVP